MILWLLLYTLSSFAQDQSIEEYCFVSANKMRVVHGRLRFILVPVDKVEENKNCFTVNTSSHRRELIQNYVRKLEPSVQIGFSSAELKREHCQIKVEKIRSLTKQGILGGANLGQSPSISAAESSQKGTDVTSIQTLKDFALQVNQDSIQGQCRAINADRYEITLQVKKEAVPLLPPVPAGTIVVVPDAQIPKQPQETSHLETTVQLNRGEKMEIGSVVRNLKNDSSKIDINAGVNVDKLDDAHNEKVFLSIE